MNHDARLWRERVLTWQGPWVELVDIDVGDDGDGARRLRGAVAEVVEDELLVRRVETEARREHGRVRHDHRHARTRRDRSMTRTLTWIASQPSKNIWQQDRTD